MNTNMTIMTCNNDDANDNEGDTDNDGGLEKRMDATQAAHSYDYIEQGGFLIKCNDGEVVGVTSQQAGTMMHRCSFFRNCFRHGTTEESSGVIHKPDWSAAITRHLVEALTKGATTVSDLRLYMDLMEASDQAIIDLRLCNMINYSDPVSQRASRNFAELMSDPATLRFSFRGVVSSQKWEALLEDGVLLSRKITNYVCKLQDDVAADRQRHQSVRNLDFKPSSFVVHCQHSIRSLMSIAAILSEQSIAHDGSGGKRQKHAEERFTVYFETESTIPQDHHELIDCLAGGESYIRTCPDTVDTTQGYTISGSFDLLRKALKPLWVQDVAGAASHAASGCAAEGAAVVVAADDSATSDQSGTDCRLCEGSSEQHAHNDNGDVGNGRRSHVRTARDADATMCTSRTAIESGTQEQGAATGCAGDGDARHRAAIHVAPPTQAERSSHLCALRIHNPTPDTLGRFVNACQQTIDYPRTLGMDAGMNLYFCKKSIRDVMIILDYMADYGHSASVSGPFAVFQRSCEKGAF